MNRFIETILPASIEAGAENVFITLAEANAANTFVLRLYAREPQVNFHLDVDVLSAIITRVMICDHYLRDSLFDLADHDKTYDEVYGPDLYRDAVALTSNHLDEYGGAILKVNYGRLSDEAKIMKNLAIAKVMVLDLFSTAALCARALNNGRGTKFGSIVRTNVDNCLVQLKKQSVSAVTRNHLTRIIGDSDKFFDRLFKLDQALACSSLSDDLFDLDRIKRSKGLSLDEQRPQFVQWIVNVRSKLSNFLKGGQNGSTYVRC